MTENIVRVRLGLRWTAWGVLALFVPLMLVRPVCEAQPTDRMYRIGFFGPSPARFVMEPFEAELRDRGWVESRHFRWERRFTGPNIESAPALARELVDLHVDVIALPI